MAFAVDLTGSLLDRRYQITGLLGKGGMGHVYEAKHVALDQVVAVKVLHPRYAYEERFRERFLQEARAASKIPHPNVVAIKDFGETPDGSVYFVMEYLRGHDVGSEIQRHGTLPWERTRNILMQAASALQAAHNQHIIHRDIKPANCFLIEDEAQGVVDVVKLLDFGIAKVGSDSFADAQGRGLTGTGEVFGTASYMSPEQARGEQLDARSDMYSLGIMAYEMLTGQVPFSGVNAIHVITQHLTTKPEPLRSFSGAIPAPVEALVLKMLAKERNDRYASMAEIEQALRELPGEAGARRTRVWSSPGDPRASVAEKKSTGPGAALPAARPSQGAAPKPAAAPRPTAGVGSSSRPAAPPIAKPGGIVSAKTMVVPSKRPATPIAKPGGAARTPHVTDQERTQMVVPTPGSAKGGAKRTMVSSDRSSRPVPRATPALPASSPPAAPVVPPARAPLARAVPAKPMASAPVARPAPATPVAPVPAARIAPPMPVSASAHGAPTMPMPPAPSTQVALARSVSPAPTVQAAPAMPPVSASMTQAASVVPVTPTSMPAAPMAVGAPALASQSPASANSGSGSLPNVQMHPGSPPGWPMMGRSDGTNPPPGRDESHGSSATWAPSTTSTGPNPRIGDTGTETHPHVLEVAPAPGVSGRFLLVVGLLVILVGVGSVVGTMVFLSSQEQAEAPKPSVEPRGVEEDPAAVTEPTQTQQSGDVPRGQQQGTEIEPAEPIPVGGDEAAEVIEEDEAVTQVDSEEVAEPSDAGQVEETQVPKVAKHETEKCAQTREAAREALDQRSWSSAAKHAKQRHCWPGSEQGARRFILVNALLESGRFPDCIAAGGGTKDAAIEKMVEICRKKVPK